MIYRGQTCSNSEDKHTGHGHDSETSWVVWNSEPLSPKTEGYTWVNKERNCLED